MTDTNDVRLLVEAVKKLNKQVQTLSHQIIQTNKCFWAFDDRLKKLERLNDQRN